jgi:hypothetical protein
MLSGSFSAFKALPGIRKGRQKWNPKELEAFVEWLRASERAIYEDISARPRQQRDTYWRMYFALFRPQPASAAIPAAIPPATAAVSPVPLVPPPGSPTTAKAASPARREPGSSSLRFFL